MGDVDNLEDPWYKMLDFHFPPLLVDVEYPRVPSGLISPSSTGDEAHTGNIYPTTRAKVEYVTAEAERSKALKVESAKELKIKD